MKLLVITNNPNRPSFRQRVEIYLDKLGEWGVFAEVVKLPKNEIERLKLFRKSSQFDGVLLQKKCLNAIDAFFLRKFAKKIIYDFDDAIMYSPNKPEISKTSRMKLFARTAKIADLIIAGNSYLAHQARQFNSNVTILPTGLDTKPYDIKPKQKDGKVRLVWIGSKSTLKYLASIKTALEQIGEKFDNVVLRIICDDFFELDNMEVEKCRWSLEGQFKDLAECDIGLAPLVDNRFTRGKCGFKILQYQAAGLPTVGSSVGVNGKIIHEGENGYLANTQTEWIEKITRLVEAPQQREQIAIAARKDVEKYDIEVIGERFCRVIEECVNPALSKPGKVQTPLVSICIPTYNRKEYLRQTLESVFAQTYKNYEIVVVDDGSTDGTEDMLKQLGIDVVYHWQENSGDAAARNKLIELAKGEYISFIDSDDLLMPDSIERLVRAMETKDEDVVAYGSYYRIDQDSRVYGKCKRKLRSGRITKYLFQTILVHCCGSMFPKRIFEQFGGFDTSLRVCSDYDMWLRLSKKYDFIALSEPTFKRRRHIGNLSTGNYGSCLIEYNVLKRFYQKKDGKNFIQERIAKKVLSKAANRAGRLAIKEAEYEQAKKLIFESLRWRFNIKAIVNLVKVVILS